MKCPYCKSEDIIVIKKKNKGFCDACNRGFEIESSDMNDIEFSDCIYKGELKINKFSELKIIKDEINSKYPFFISDLLNNILDCNSNLEACNYCNLTFFWVTRFFAFQCLCCYLNDEKVNRYYKVQESLSGLSHTYDSSWSNIITAIIECYEVQNKNFPFPILYTVMKKLFDIKYGYKDAIYGTSIQDYEKKDLSLIQAAKNLRNIMSHDKRTPIDETIAKKIIPYYRDIIFAILSESKELLDGEVIKFISHVNNNNFKLLQGDGRLIDINLSRKQINSITQNTDVIIYNTIDKQIYPLFPFLIKMLDGVNTTEMYYDAKSSNEILYVGWKNNQHILRKDGYKRLLELLDRKNHTIKKSSIKEIDFKYIKDSAIEKTLSTLKKDYLMKKYISDCYIAPKWLIDEFNAFLQSSKTAFLLSGDTGIGKSAFLSHIAYEYSTSENNNIIPLFLNGADIDYSYGKQPIAVLLKEYLLIEESVNLENLTKIFEEFDQIINRSNNNEYKILLIIDAVNEYYSQIQLFEEIDKFLSESYEMDTGERKYKWIQVVFSIRKTGIDQIYSTKMREIGRPLNNDCIKIFRCDEAYYKINDERVTEEGSIEEVQTPIILIKEFNESEIESVFYKHLRFGKLVGKEIPITVLENKYKLLRKPLNLMIFIELLTQNDNFSLSINFGENILIDKYIDSLLEDEKDFLDNIIRIMIEEEHRPIISYERVKIVLKKYSDWAELNKIYFYRDPLERLISMNMLSYEVSSNTNEDFLKVKFVYQKICEQCIVKHFKKYYKNLENKCLVEIISNKSVFEEYLNAISQLFYELWSNEKIEMLLLQFPTKNEKYLYVLSNAIYKELEDCVNEKLNIVEQQKIAKRYDQRLNKLLLHKKKLKQIHDIENVFTVDVLLKYRNRMCSEVILDSFIDAGISIFKEKGIKNSEYCSCLRYLGDRLKSINPELALKKYEESLDDAYVLSEKNPNDILLKHDIIITYNNIGYLYMQQVMIDKAFEIYSKGKEISELFYSSEINDVLLAEDIGLCYNRLAGICIHRGKYKEAKDLYVKAFNIFEKLSINMKDDEIVLKDFICCINCMGYINLLLNNFEEASNNYNKSLLLAKRLYEKNQNNYKYVRGLILNYTYIGDVNIKQGKMLQAKEAYIQAKDLCEDLHQFMSDNVDISRDLVISRNNLGYVFMKEKKYAVSESLFKDALCLGKELMDKLPFHRISRDVAVCLNNYGHLRMLQECYNEARNYYNDGLRIRKEIYMKDKNNSTSRYNVIMSLKSLAHLEILQGNIEVANKLLENAKSVNKQEIS